MGGGNFALAQKALPYSYGFENNDLSTEGWTKAGDNISTSTAISKSGSFGVVVYKDDYSFRFSANSSPYPPQYLISPLLDNSATGIDVSFYYNNNGSSDGETFCVGYSTNTSAVADFIWDDATTVNKGSGWLLHSTSFPTGTKYIAIKYTSQNKNKIFIDEISIEESETYKRPKNLVVDSYTTSSATLSWTNGRNEEAWQIAYSIKEDFTPNTEGTKVAVTENPYTLSGLTEGVTYYAYVRSNYSGNYSEWSNKIECTPGLNITANNGTGASENIPFTGASVTSLNKCQFIIPSAQLTDIQNRSIISLTFYTSSSSLATAEWGDATFDIYLKNTTNSTFSNTTYDEDWGTRVCSAKTLSLSNHEMTILFDTPFTYTSNNLMIGFEQKTTGTNSSTCKWITNLGSYGNTIYGTSTVSKTSALPKVTLTSISLTVPATLGTNGYTTFASPRALDLANLPSGLKAYKAAVDAQNNKVLFTEINQEVPANTGMLLEGTAETTYNIPVAESGTAPEGNDFLVNSTGGTFTADEDYTYYGMKKATSASDPIVFATFAPATVAIPTNKAYLKVANAPSGASRQLVCAFSDNTTTAIAEIANRQNGQNSYFNLAGQRVDGSRFTVNGSGLKPGLYIINGKKMVIK